MLRRTLVVLAFAVWFGGLTFYSLVVIPVAHGVLRSHRRVGFITQDVTDWINAAGIAAVGALLWDLLATRTQALRRVRLLSLSLMAVAQAALLALHPALEGMLDPATMDVADPDRFYAVHRVYLLVTAVQWTAAVAHLATVLKSWTPAGPTS